MNNSFVTFREEDDTEEIQTKLNAEEATLVKIIEALSSVRDSKEWSTLKTEVFDNLVNVIERNLKSEAKKESPDPNKLNRLAGELKWAEKFSDLQKLEDSYRTQLSGIRKQIHGKTE